MSRLSVVSALHGSEMSQSRYVRATVYSAAAGGILASRSSSRSASFLASSVMPAASTFCAELVELLGPVVGLAQLLLDGLELLAEIELALALAHLRFDLRLDLRAELEHFGFLGEDGASRERRALMSPVSRSSCLTSVLSAGSAAAITSASRPGSDTFWTTAANSSGRSGDSATTWRKSVAALRTSASRLEIVGRADLGHGLDARPEVRAGLHHLDEPNSHQSLHDQAHGAVGLLQDLVNRGQRADTMEIGGLGLLGGRIALGEDSDQLPGADGLLDQGQRRRASRGERQDGLRKQHGIPKRQNGQLVRHAHARVPGGVDGCLFVWHGWLSSPPGSMRQRPGAQNGSTGAS